MPKELIHFTVAERTATLLSDTQYGPALNKEQDTLLLGAIFHDALFHVVNNAGKPLESLAHALHGAKGQDTYKLIRLQTSHAATASDNLQPVAGLVGIVSHLFADEVMHPMVYHFTGDYYDASPKKKSLARQHHRAMEALMDMVACPEMIGRARYKIRHLLRRSPNFNTQAIPIKALAKMAGMNELDAGTQLDEAWKIFATIQTLAATPWLARTLFALRPYLPAFMAETICLLYAPQLAKQATVINGDINFIHPVSGNPISTTLNDLMDTAARKAANLCLELEPAIFNGGEITIDATGPSMDAGMSGVGTNAMLHFASTHFPRLD